MPRSWLGSRRDPMQVCAFCANPIGWPTWWRRSRRRCRPEASAQVFRGEAVAGAAHGLEQSRLLAVGLDQLAQPGDLVVDAAVIGCPVMALEQVHDLVAAEHATRVARKQRQEVAFTTGQGHAAVARPAEVPAAEIERGNSEMHL